MLLSTIPSFLRSRLAAPSPRGRVLALVLAAALVAAASDVGAADARPSDGRPGWWPTGGFAQFGAAESAQMAVLGLTWEWSWRRPFLGGEVGGYWEISFGRWNADSAPRGSGWFTQVGVTPVLRWYVGGPRRWFAEAGIGANLLLPIYENDSENKRFSTTFNFGDHLAVGRRFGHDGGQSVSLRFQHFSNASIRKPNPGENFLQLRYSRSF
jgi:lipid A 3-O-deacylase